jgi:rhodanese-related sulfurtransferase
MSANFRDMLAGVKQEISEIGVHEVRDSLNGSREFVLLDVREKDEWEQGHLEGAVFLPRGFLEVKRRTSPSSSTAPAAFARLSRPSRSNS